MVAFPERKPVKGLPDFRVMNSCIAPTYLMDGASIVTIEGLKKDGELCEVQKRMVECHGSQCGFCTPGFVVAMSSMFEAKKKVTEQDVKNYTTGNLCRCTGYLPIVNAGMAVDPKKVESLRARFLTPAIQKDLIKISKTPFEISTPEKRVHGVVSAREVSKILVKHKNARIVSSATDLGVVYNKERIELEHVITLHHVRELFECKATKSELFVGAKVDLSVLQKAARISMPTFANFLRLFASPQIRNVATLVGNIANGSPIADTLPFLMVMNAKLEIQGPRLKRVTPINGFYKGYKKMDLKPGEWISAVRIPLLQKDERLFLYKISQRRDLDISTVNAGFFTKGKSTLSDLRIAYGGVGPTVLRLPKTEKHLRENFSAEGIKSSLSVAQTEMTPLSDLRGSEEFRRKVSNNLLKKFYLEAKVQS